MSDEKETVQQVDPAAEASKLDAHVLRPIDELVKSMQTHDAAIRSALGGLKRLFKQSKGNGNASLTEHIQLYAALYGLIHLGQTQSVIVGQQLANDGDRREWHVRALQNFLFTVLLKAGIQETDAEGKPLDEVATREKWKGQIDGFYKAERQKAMDTRAALFDKHKEDVFDAAVGNMQRPPLQKQDTPPAEDKKIITLARG